MKRYEGSFRSILHNTLYRVEIWQDGYAGHPSAVAFTSEPLAIEWAEVDKLTPVQSSSAQLELLADSDRQFIDLYTIVAGSVRMDVYREGVLYWSGTLDPELYEEPYAYKEGYGVRLTFTDFAILDRLQVDLTGLVTPRAAISAALVKSCISFAGIITHISTSLSWGNSATFLNDILLQSDNYYDEDGVAMSWREVLDAILRTFALRLVQKAGGVYIYDLNAISSEQPVAVKWSTDDAVMSVDKVYNNVKVTYSPYAATKLIDAEIDSDSVTGSAVEVKYDSTLQQPGFVITLGAAGKGLMVSGGAKYFKIEPRYSGNAEAGVAWTVRVNVADKYYSYANDMFLGVGGEIIRVPKQPYISVGNEASRYRLLVSLATCLDVRGNYYEPAGDYNEGKDYDTMKDTMNIVYIPVMLTIRDSVGKALYHYVNNGVRTGSDHGNSTAAWAAGEAAWGDMWLCYYDAADREDNTGIGGWQTNKRIIGKYNGALPAIFDKKNDGEYIVLPPVSGYLDYRIGSGMKQYTHTFGSNYDAIADGPFMPLRWALYKNPAVQLVREDGATISEADRVTKAWINRDAKEELSIDNIIGAEFDPLCTAKGQVLAASSEKAQAQFARGGIISTPERLLISTVYANYASRHLVLSGTVDLLATWCICTEKNEPGKYVVQAERQDLYNDESRISIVQFSEDNYEEAVYEE